MRRTSVALFFLLIASPVWSADKIGFVDIQRAITESKAGKQAKENFRSQVKEVEAGLLKEKEKLERMKSEIDKKALLLNEQERRNIERDLQRRVRDYQRSMRDSQEELRQKESEMTAGILEELQKVVISLGESEKFTLIFGSGQLLYADEGIDITDKVIKLYDSSGAKAAQSK